MHFDIRALQAKKTRLIIGLMSGTSADGIDAVLTEISGNGTDISVSRREFLFVPFSASVRERILLAAEGGFGGSAELCRLNALLGRLYADACLALCRNAGVEPGDIDIVGNHGQTVWHMPADEDYLSHSVRGTLQIGEDAIIAEALGCPVIGDFRVRDMAAGGLGAPLVPYTEYLLYRDAERNFALQNIGGIGNVTVLPKNCTPEQVIAFDTGPGNMVIDALVKIMTGGAASYDDGGRMASAGETDAKLLRIMLDDSYLAKSPPKATGREYFGEGYVKRLTGIAEAHNICILDVLATATRFTAESIAVGIRNFSPVRPDRLIVGGGGSRNLTMLGHLRECLPDCEVITNEEIGFDSDAKEAEAFAILANEALCGIANNMPSVTGARHPVVMGKLTL